jgi:hypothetical protein
VFRIRPALSTLASILLLPLTVIGNQDATSQNPTSILQQSAAALGGTKSIRSATLNGIATYYGVTIPESGSATLSALNDQNSSVVVSLPSVSVNEVRTISDGLARGTGSCGAAYTIPERNLLTSAAWFFPVFLISAGATSPTYASSYVGLERKQTVLVHHIRIWQRNVGLSDDRNEALRALSSEDVFLDSSTLLPVATSFQFGDLTVEVYFSDYRQLQGMTFAYRVQLYMQGVQTWDIRASTISVDTDSSGPTIQVSSCK